MKKLLFLPVVAALCCQVSVHAGELPGTLVLRTMGDADKNEYISGYSAAGKGNFGYQPETTPNASGKTPNMWKAFVVFDAVSAVEELAQKPSGTLDLAVDWVKDPDNVTEARVVYVGAFPSIEVTDANFYDKYSEEGIEIGTIPVAELAALKGQQKFPFEIDGKIPSGEVTPANRYLIFRVEGERPENPDESSMVGLSPEPAAHTLKVGGANDEASGSTGGY